MEQNNRSPKQYTGTKGLSLAIVVGVALGTLIGKLMDNMRIGLMIGLVLAVCVWTLVTQRRAKAAALSEKENLPGDTAKDSDKSDIDKQT